MNLRKNTQYIDDKTNKIVKVLKFDSDSVTHENVITKKAKTESIFAFSDFRELTDEEHCDLNQPSGIVPACIIITLILLIVLGILFAIIKC